MKTSIALFISLFFLAPACFGQYYGGGYGGYGRPMGGMSQQPQADFKPSVPNIAGDLANRETKWLKEKLSLTKEQAKAVKDLNNQYGKEQQEAIKEIVKINGGMKADMPEAQRKAQMDQIKDAMLMYNEQKEVELKTILTPNQWASYQRSKDDMQREVGGFRPPAPKEFQAKKDTLVKE
jgi:O-methyltransferase involved in polyketide biosynthesis